MPSNARKADAGIKTPQCFCCMDMKAHLSLDGLALRKLDLKQDGFTQMNEDVGGKKRKPGSVSGLEALGRERLSRHFFMRDFLYSEIGNFF